MANAAETDVAAEAGLFEADEIKDQGPQVYEIGYHFLPTLSEQEVEAAVKDLMNFLTTQGANFVGEKLPVKTDLAYAIEKRINGTLTDFSAAYFGWVAFEVEPRTTETIKKFMDTNPSVLRYLILTTSKDEVTAVMEGKVLIPTAAASTEAIAAPKRAVEESGTVSDAKLDEAIEAMTEEDKKVE